MIHYQHTFTFALGSGWRVVDDEADPFAEVATDDLRERVGREAEIDLEWLTDVSDLDYLGRLVYGEAIDGSDDTQRGSRMDAGYGDSGMF